MLFRFLDMEEDVGGANLAYIHHYQLHRVPWRLFEYVMFEK